MKKLILGIFILSSLFSFAQNNQGKQDDSGRIILNSVVSDKVKMPAEAKSVLETKLSQITSSNGMGGSKLNPRFVLTPNVIVEETGMTPTAPAMVYLNLSVVFYVGDGIEGTLFANQSISVKGVGETETKAYIAAFRNIKSADPKLKTLLEEGKNKIITYYNTQCDFIIKEAQSLADQNKFDEAIFKLVQVPNVCKECFDKCNEAVAPLFKRKIDRECQLKLAEAKGIWNSSISYEGGQRAAQVLATIEPQAACYGEVKSLLAEIEKRVRELDKREWAFTLREQDLEFAVVEAARAVGVAYGNGQPQSVTYNNMIAWW
jgi:hypothetical protein